MLQILRFWKWTLHFNDDAEDYDSKQFSRCQPKLRSRLRKMDVDYKHEYISSEEQRQRQILSICSDQESI